MSGTWDGRNLGRSGRGPGGDLGGASAACLGLRGRSGEALGTQFRPFSRVGASASAGRKRPARAGWAVAVLPCAQCLASPPIAALGHQPRSHMQSPLTALGAGIAVEERGFLLGLGGVRGRCFKRRANRHQASGSATVGQEAEVPDPHEAFGKHMEQEAAYSSSALRVMTLRRSPSR